MKIQFVIIWIGLIVMPLGNAKANLIDSLRTSRNSALEAEDKITLDIALGNAYNDQVAYDSAIFFFERAFAFAEEVVLLDKKAQALLGLGSVYYDLEGGFEAIHFFNDAVAIPNGLLPQEKIKSLNMSGVIYLRYQEFDKAIEYFDEALLFCPEAEKLSGKTYEFLFNNKGITYALMGQFDTALFNHNKCLEIRLKKENNYNIGQSYNNLGTVFYEMSQYDSALIYFERGLDFRKRAKKYTPTGIWESEINISKALLRLGQFKKAEFLMNRLKTEIDETNNLDLKQRLAKERMFLYEGTNNYKKAYLASVDYFTFKDSLYGIDEREELIHLSISNKYAEKRIQDSLIVLEEEKVEAVKKAKEIEIQKEKDRAASIIQIGLIIALILTLGIVLLVYRNYRSKKRTADEILKQKLEVEKQRDIAQIEKNSANKQREIAQKQKGELELVHQEITDSITYAKRIQNAILPSTEMVKRALQDQFILYLPKAIVAGDFYWVRSIGDCVYFAAADCTGHGVPGALVSIICSNALNRAVEEFGLRETGVILDKSTDLLIEAFRQSNQEVKDGMDISLCCYNRRSKKYTFSGANNPIYIVKKKKKENNNIPEGIIQNEIAFLVEVKGDKQAVGLSEFRKKFSTNTLEVEKGDMIYLFTDGFPDQFGGVRGKKYKYKPFKNFLLKMAGLPLATQQKVLENEFENWKGNLEQVDDVCVIGYCAE